jgi:hypothetical protein
LRNCGCAMGVKSWSLTSSVRPAPSARNRRTSPRLPWRKLLRSGPRTPCARRRLATARGRHTRRTSKLNRHDATAAATTVASIHHPSTTPPIAVRPPAAEELKGDGAPPRLLRASRIRSAELYFMLLSLFFYLLLLLIFLCLIKLYLINRLKYLFKYIIL